MVLLVSSNEDDAIDDCFICLWTLSYFTLVFFSVVKKIQPLVFPSELFFIESNSNSNSSFIFFVFCFFNHFTQNPESKTKNQS